MSPVNAETVALSFKPGERRHPFVLDSRFIAALRVSSSRRTVSAALLSTLLAAGCTEQPSASRSIAADIALDTVSIIRSEEFDRIRTVKQSNLGLAILNEGPRQVLLLNDDGQVRSRIGRLGRGPGEFQALTDAAIRHDTLFVLDALMRRISVFHSGLLHREVHLGDAPGIAERIFVPPAGPLILIVTTPAQFIREQASTVHRDTTRVLALVSQSPGPEWRERFAFPGSERFFQVVGEGYQPGRPAFWATTSYSANEVGVAAADGRSGRITFVDWQGTSRSQLDHSPVARIVAEPELELARVRIDQMDRRRPDLRFRQFAEAAFEVWGDQIPRPFYEGVVSDGSIVAVQSYEYDDSAPARWSVFARTGELLGYWTVPSNVRILEYSAGTVFAVATDSLDVESVLVLAARLPASSR